MITGGDLRQSRLDVGYKTFTISPWYLMAVNYFKYIDGLRSHYVSTIYAEACCSVLCFLRLSTRKH